MIIIPFTCKYIAHMGRCHVFEPVFDLPNQVYGRMHPKILSPLLCSLKLRSIPMIGQNLRLECILEFILKNCHQVCEVLVVLILNLLYSFFKDLPLTFDGILNTEFQFLPLLPKPFIGFLLWSTLCNWILEALVCYWILIQNVKATWGVCPPFL